MSASPGFTIYSTVTVERIEYEDAENNLETPPIADDEDIGIPDPIDPQGVLENDDPAVLVVVHAPEEESDGAPPITTAIGGVYLPPGVYDDVEVPIIPPVPVEPPDEVIASNNGDAEVSDDDPIISPLQEEVFPPNPNGDTDVVVQAWGFVSGEGEGDDPAPEPLSLDGEPLRDSATVSDLDRNPGRAPVGDGLRAPTASVVDEPSGVILANDFPDTDVLSFNGETDTLSTAPTPVKNAADGVADLPGNSGITAPDPSDEYFILGLHHPDVGSGDPTERDSLVGIAPLPLGEFAIVGVRVSETPFTDSEDFPPTEDKDLTVTLWHGPGGQFQGPIGDSFGDGPIQAEVSVSNLFDPSA